MAELIQSWILAGGAWAVAFLMLAENVFPPIPSELIMPFAGYLAADGQLSALAVILFGTVGSVFGALLWYWLALAVGQERFLSLIDRYGFWLTVSRDEAERALRWFSRWGYWAVFFGRLVPTVRTLISVPAALAKMPFLPFLLISALGSLVWVTALTLAGYLLHANYARVEHWVSPVTTVIVVAIVVTYVVRAVLMWRARRD